MKELGKLGLAKSDIDIMLSFIMLAGSFFSVELFGKFALKAYSFWLFAIINVVLFIISIILLNKAREYIKSQHYSYFGKVIVPEIQTIIVYILLIFVFIPVKFFQNKVISVLIANIYVIALLILVMIYLIAMMLPYSYSKGFKENEIGNFYRDLSSTDICLDKLEKLISNEKELNIFIRPMYISNECGQKVLKNLEKLKKNNISAYFELKTAVQQKTTSVFWNIGSITVALFSIFITLYSNKFFNDIINTFSNTERQAQVNNFSFFGETLIVCIFILVIAGLIKFSDQELNKKFYVKMLMYFDEVDNQ